MLPSPTATRFQPLRSGLINLFKYQEQEFWYERGRLLIRGNNGSGKSRVLALQLPFLLDGEISPRRVEPDGDPARQIAWHLLMDEHEQRTGYTWIEFGRRDEAGAEYFFTLGCGMRAIRGGDNQPTRWFFITERRVGQDFSLLQGAHPLSAERLGEVIGEECLYKAARDYRFAIDKRLFGIGSERYEALIELLIRLRAPQLAKKLNADLLFSALSDALPPLPATVVEQVAAAFKNLDDLREQRETLIKLSRALANFHTGYQSYLQAALLRRAGFLRSRHVEFESAQRQVNTIERELSSAQTAETDAKAAVGLAEDTFTKADARLQAIQQSERAQDAQTLDYAQQTAASEQRSADDAEKNAKEASARQTTIEEDIEKQTALFDEHAIAFEAASREAVRLAAPAGIASEHSRVVPIPTVWPVDTVQLSKLKFAHAKIAGDHDYRLKQIEAGLETIRKAQTALSTAQQAEDRLASAITTYSSTVEDHDQSARVSTRLLAETYGRWHATLRWLAPPPWSELSPAFDDWLETADDAHRNLASTIAGVARDESALLATARADLKSRQDALAAEYKLLTDERALLAAGPPPPPAAPATRDPDSRIGRAGAPLWQVCEFNVGLTSEQRAGLEAALESAGLLDAWISPDGSLAGELPSDIFLVTTPIATDPTTAGATLADWLQPDLSVDLATATGLDTLTLRSVLTRIGAGQSDTRHWVALDGRWQLGPVFGRGQKPSAIHLGATGREAARLHRLDEIALGFAALGMRQTHLDSESSQLDIRATAAEAERLTAPSDHNIARLLTLRTEAHRQLDVAKLNHATAVQETHRTRQAFQKAEEKLQLDARDLGYTDNLHRLAELRTSWAPYAQAVIQLWGDAQAWITSSDQMERLAGQKRASDEEVARTADTAQTARTAALRSAENYRTLAQNLGASIEEYQRELQIARAARTNAQTELNKATDAYTSTIKVRAALEASLGPAKEKVIDADQRRHTAILELRVPLLHGLFPEAHPSLTDIEKDDWAPTRAYAIARRLDKELPSTDLADFAWTDRLNTLNTQINDLRTLTGALGCQVVSRVLGEGLTAVNCHYLGSALTPGHCLAAVERERETHERLLSDGERAIIDRHLVTEVSLQLQTLIENARLRTDEMNAEMTRCATTLGVTLRLVWESVSEGLPAGLPYVRKLLLADHAAWSDEERATVGRFLHQLIQEERARDPAAPGTEQLLRALDYRRWHAFAADRRQNNRWERLTRKRYGTGSGGEKALMLTIPQMAAASSHYKNAAAHAPRLILLDEAFAGMDKPTRARCMGLLEAFDLDLLMTSEREWGAHATVSGIAIYQLVADSDAVAATRWVWNGKKNQLAPVPDTPELRAPVFTMPASNDELGLA